MRWLKYVQTYEGWLDYIVHKVHRRTGLGLQLTDAERACLLDALVSLATDAAARYLAELHAEFESWSLAIAGYTHGAGMLRQAIADRSPARFAATNAQAFDLGLQAV